MKKDILEYKGFIGSVHFSADDDVFFGKIEEIDDLVTFEGSSVKSLHKSFREAVEDYLELCKQVGKEPLRSVKGSFNIRITPELHRKAIRLSKQQRMNLNQFVQKAIEQAVARNC
ncbi:type II toxin-antitoxin system HicB family antitoxin [Chitinophaga japonensis]|uniref:Putative HicB family RNase H-like nuclease n=1 Tax=Chitinophaga japonensis TaxID=104662 RepID=A0A562TF60_CHIJA|nr:type II toxin-antitoxin system HicB family antitoxin [Chitinophaga japonensis]TWI91908.1 putative HicB family RNase H-like nuclease [Chitinophaga japonensis]